MELSRHSEVSLGVEKLFAILKSIGRLDGKHVPRPLTVTGGEDGSVEVKEPSLLEEPVDGGRC